MVKIVGGDNLSARIKEIAANVSKAAEVQIGFLENSTYPDGTSVPMVAAIQEFGAPARNIPPRPYFRGMIRDHVREWPEAVANLLVANDYDSAVTLDQTGAAIAGQLRQSIVDFSGFHCRRRPSRARASTNSLWTRDTCSTPLTTR